MTGLRAHLCQHPLLVAALLVLAIAMRALVPAGYMIDTRTDHLTVVLCSGSGEAETVTIQFERDGSAEHGGTQSAHADMPCAFSALTMGSLAGADAPLLALALAVILAIWLAAPRAFALRTADNLQPPSRGPPPLI